MKQDVTVWENERWSLRTWKFGPTKSGKIDPPPWTDINGLATSIEHIERTMEAHSKKKLWMNSDVGPSQSGIRKRWKWVEGSSWKEGPWVFALAFQTEFKSQKDKTTFVRRRRWSREAETISPQNRKQHMGVSFNDDTVYTRQLESRKWRSCASTRNGPKLLLQYRVDCRACGISAKRCLAAFLALDGIGVFDIQAKARQVLAGVAEWPVGAATSAADSRTDPSVDVLCDEIFTQMHDDLIALGSLAEARDIARKTLAMVTVNAQHRKTGEDERSDSQDPPNVVTDNAQAQASGIGELHDYIDSSILAMDTLIKGAEQSEMGWEGSEGWFVIDEGVGGDKAKVTNTSTSTTTNTTANMMNTTKNTTNTTTNTATTTPKTTSTTTPTLITTGTRDGTDNTDHTDHTDNNDSNANDNATVSTCLLGNTTHTNTDTSTHTDTNADTNTDKTTDIDTNIPFKHSTTTSATTHATATINANTNTNTTSNIHTNTNTNTNTDVSSVSDVDSTQPDDTTLMGLSSIYYDAVQCHTPPTSSPSSSSFISSTSSTRSSSSSTPQDTINQEIELLKKIMASNATSLPDRALQPTSTNNNTNNNNTTTTTTNITNNNNNNITTNNNNIIITTNNNNNNTNNNTTNNNNNNNNTNNTTNTTNNTNTNNNTNTITNTNNISITTTTNDDDDVDDDSGHVNVHDDDDGDTTATPLDVGDHHLHATTTA